jgi:hypothetical protein
MNEKKYVSKDEFDISMIAINSCIELIHKRLETLEFKMFTDYKKQITRLEDRIDCHYIYLFRDLSALELKIENLEKNISRN